MFDHMDKGEIDDVRQAVQTLVSAAGLKPEEVFDTEDLKAWAEDNGYVETHD